MLTQRFFKLVVTLSLAGVTFAGCDDGEATEPAPAPDEHANPEDDAEASGDDAELEGSAEQAELEEIEVQESPLPPEVLVTPATTAFSLGTGGGTLVAGELSLAIPDGALPEETLIEIEVMAAPEELGRDLPGSLALGVYRGSPWNPQLSRAARLTVPLLRELPQGTSVELLAWQPQMRAFIVAGYARVDATGRQATFPVRQLGDMLVRATPVQSETATVACPVDAYTLHDAWPIASEDNAVRLTEVDDRYPRELAFSLLSDFRLSPAFGLIDFKNEEVVNGSAFAADERNHQDEDYLMDPNAAAALTALAALVAHEWVDPLSGEPAVRVRVTEAFDSLIEHSARSTHYQGRAIDLTVSPVPAADGASRRAWYGRLSALAQCAGFDWVLFENNAHVHASVVGTELAFVTSDGTAMAAATSTLRRPRELHATSRRWAEAPGETVDVSWQGGDAFQLVNHPVRPEGDAQGEADSDVALASHVTVDGLRRVVVRDGRAYLLNTAPVPPLGSVNADGTPVDVEYPLPLSPPGTNVVSASFREHARTQSAMEQHVLAAPR